MPPELANLTPEEKLDLIGQLWDSLSEEDVPVRQSHIDEVERRAARLAANPELGLTWDEVKRRVRARHGR